MKSQSLSLTVFVLICFCLSNQATLLANQAPDPEAYQELDTMLEKRPDTPAKNFASGVKQAAYDGPKEFLQETAQGAKENPITGTLEGTRKGAEKVIDHTIRGTAKVATLGFGDAENYEIEEGEKGSGDPTKIKVGLPW